MNYASLRKHINALACLPAGGAPVISAYLDLATGAGPALARFGEWLSMTRQTFGGDDRRDFDDAADEIRGWIPRAGGRSAAVFARWGEQPLFLPMEFEVPLENRFHAGDVPAIYPLVELKDRFNRFVVALVTDGSARIIEVNLGQQSLELLTARPALRERIGREWTREHYQNHKRDRDRRFLKEKIEVIEGLMAKHGHNSLIIAGDARQVKHLTEALPPHLSRRLVGEIKRGFDDQRIGPLISQAVESFLQAERDEAHDAAADLVRAVRAGGLAAVGHEATRRALAEGRAERLVVSSSLEHGLREELVRLASQQDIPIETVQGCELLDRNGRAGVLLRYASETAGRSAAMEAEAV